MRRIKMMGLCLVVVGALAAVVVSSASAALPEFKVCAKAAKNAEKKYTGKYTDKLCSHAVTAEEIAAGKTNKYELASWEAAKKTSFKGKNGTSTLTSYIPENESTPWTGGSPAGVVTCKSGKSAGNVTGPKTETVQVEFKTCTSEGKKCTSTNGAKSGTIKTEPLSATIGYIEGGVGADVEAASHKLSAEFTCEGLAIKTIGSVIGVVTGNINKISKESTQTFAANEKHGQAVVFGEFPENPETGPAHFLLSNITPPGVTLPSTEVTTSVLKGEAMEIAA
jgi:hypothetical protein